MTGLRASAANPVVASVALLLGGGLWGLFWLPARALSSLGPGGTWPGAMMYAGTAIMLVPVIIWRWRQLVARWRQLAVCGIFTGTAFSFYSTSLLLTDVVHSILLFYLTPVWGTILGRVVLGERVTAGRTLALGLALVGLVVVLGGTGGWPWPRNIGDWLALVSGMLWAVGTLALYRMGRVAVFDQVSAFILGAVVAAAASLALGGPELGGAIEMRALVSLAPWGLLAGLYLLPMTLLTIWPASMLSPGRVGVLLMSEVVVGVGSAAVLAGEPFGLREAAGSALIIGAALVEVAGSRVTGRPVRARRSPVRR